jgi:hypothetical protein
MAQHLWEVDHDYYCNRSNFFSNECEQAFDSWELFLEAEGDAEFNSNLLFRWDWDPKAKTLTLFWMGQRKGLFRSTLIRGMHPDEEQSVREWLIKRWAHLHKLWSPISDLKPKRGR